MSINIAVVGGKVGNDPRMRTASSNAELQIANFSIATNEERVSSNERKTETTWHNIVVIGGKLINVVQYIRKGSYITVTGRIRTRKLDDMQNPGQSRYITEIIARSIDLGAKVDRDNTHAYGESSGNISSHNDRMNNNDIDSEIIFDDREMMDQS